jgi:Bacterial membrane protein YfhO
MRCRGVTTARRSWCPSSLRDEQERERDNDNGRIALTIADMGWPGQWRVRSGSTVNTANRAPVSLPIYVKNRIVYTSILICFFAAFLACYAPVIFSGRQFGYRDGAHFYYPLYQRVQREWQEGRWPLWEPEENAGVPLLGNPTAAVMYPGKFIYAILPYPWAARIYVVAHTGLAFCTMLVLMRSWETSWVGSAISALAYAFGAPVLFQYCNIIYLIGAAWLPLGFRAVDCWVRLGRRMGILELAIVMAMQVLGGDPQSAYLLGLAGGGYAVGLAYQRSREARPASPRAVECVRPFPFVLIASAVGLVLAVWFVGTVTLALWVPKLREPGTLVQPIRFMAWFPTVVSAAWGVAAIGFLYYWRTRGWRYPLGVMWLGLAASAALALAVTAIQLFPVVEFTQQTSRAAGAGSHDIYPYSIEPYRLIELVWPNVMGIEFRGNCYWGNLLRLPGMQARLWVPTLYLGGLTLALSVSALTFQGGGPRRVWFSTIVLISLFGSLGQYTSPIWITRVSNEMVSRPVGGNVRNDAALSADSAENPDPRASAAIGRRTTALVPRWLPDLGTVDPIETTAIRQDGYLRDGDGGFYWWLTTALPGFRQFRYPAKLFTLTALGVAGLAGMGWDRLSSGRTRGMTVLLCVIMSLTFGCLVAVTWYREPILNKLNAASLDSSLGPFQPDRAYAAIVRALAHSLIVAALALVLVRLAWKRSVFAGPMALFVLTADLAMANAQYVLTVPQRVFEAQPEALEHIQAEERARPATGPYRVHRMALWAPIGWTTVGSADRVSDFVSWDRGTLQPKHAINLGVEYTQTIGVSELYDYECYFRRFFVTIRDPAFARSLPIAVGKEVVYYPRRAFDMWNTRYFVVPAFPNGWHDAPRASATFRFQSELVYPKPSQFKGADSYDDFKKWVETKDYQIYRNLSEYPRAWVVRSARAITPVVGLSREPRADAMLEMIYAADPVWHDETRNAFDARKVAWIESAELVELQAFLTGDDTNHAEHVNVTYPSPQTAALEVTLQTPGLVVLADAFYPGWELTVDGQPAPIHRVNFMMRGAAVPSGKHRLEYRFAPLSFRVGCVVSVLGAVALLVFGVFCFRHPDDPVLAPAARKKAAMPF